MVLNPNIVFLLLALGGFALAAETVHPTFVGGALGVALLVFGLISVAHLPVNWLGVLLIVLAFALLRGDLHLGGRGLLAVPGIAALIAGGLLLFGGAGAGVSLWLVLLTSAVIAGLFIGGIATLYRSRRRPSVVGEQTFIGRDATVRTPLNPTGYVTIDGETWRATLLEGSAEPGETVTIVDVHGLELTVWRTRPPARYFGRGPRDHAAAAREKE